MSQSRRQTGGERPAKTTKRNHQGPLFATPLSQPGTDIFSSMPPCWTPLQDSLYLHQDPAIYGETHWNDAQKLSSVEYVESLPTTDQFDFSIFQSNSHQVPPAPSTVSSVTYSSPSIISQPSSAGSGLSPTQTELPYEWPNSKSVTYSRANSPTQTIERGQSSFVCLGPQCQDTFDRETELNEHFKSVHTHTCNWADCAQPSFSSREGLTWHVKLEHLLVCPVLGCTESSCQNKRLLESHMRVAHPGISEGKGKKPAEVPKLVAPAMLPSISQNSSTGTLTSKDIMEDKVVKKNLSITLAKRRCEHQLKSVVERRYKRQNDSPSDLSRARSSRLIESAVFPLIWEHGVLPFLVEFLPKWCGPNHVVSVTRGNTIASRRICIMTKQKPSLARRVIIAGHVRDLLPETHRPNVTFVFSIGSVTRLTWARDPCMGDSIGIEGSEHFEESTATLGPCLVVGGGSCWLANFHPFIDAYQHHDSVTVQHPSPGDRSHCVAKRHDVLPDSDFALGKLIATSGIDLKTTRISHDAYWEDNDKEPPLVVTDWILISSRSQQANILRHFPSETMPLLKTTPVKTTSSITPGAAVISTGRTSGQQRGQICEIPAYVNAETSGTGKSTREWFVEEPFSAGSDTESWIRGGIGVEGDSGAAIVDVETNSLVGQLWGRNTYFGPGPRLTFFTPINDIFDDIQERCGQQSRPKLPQYREEAECYPVHPSCRTCYDLRTYLDCRRSSRESLRSIVGRLDSDHGEPSIEGTSELATPKDVSWGRHAIDEVGSVFSITSPHAFTTPGTPGIVDIKSPYAPTLNIEDLYEDVLPTTGKRAAGTRSASNAKRQRLT
ncbi:hypothetical protein C8035_v002968 [Colletotrichum spinosum]|uniref:C2H2-type domain-containing protein n=1 Tax=Colletotrichum spinosum TaxID=1347390 RepID=A0A4R8PNA8_9PEZI|nr:hypothetical protein C8035_v002968 [Colletotrichum spinosum]